MRLVEVRVREAALQPDSVLGVHLMKKAFGERGRLRTTFLEAAEAEARMALFWGAIGVYKNPTSHRLASVQDPQAAFEAIMLANTLLRITEDVLGEVDGLEDWDQAVARAYPDES